MAVFAKCTSIGGTPNRSSRLLSEVPFLKWHSLHFPQFLSCCLDAFLMAGYHPRHPYDSTVRPIVYQKYLPRYGLSPQLSPVAPEILFIKPLTLSHLIFIWSFHFSPWSSQTPRYLTAPNSHLTGTPETETCGTLFNKFQHFVFLVNIFVSDLVGERVSKCSAAQAITASTAF